MTGCQNTYKNKPVSGLVKLHANHITLHIYVCVLHFVECEKPAKKSMARDSLKSIEDLGYKFNEGIIYIYIYILLLEVNNILLISIFMS